jgi:hypothetical protein
MEILIVINIYYILNSFNRKIDIDLKGDMFIGLAPNRSIKINSIII